MIQQTNIEGRTYYTAIKSGVEYTAMRNGDNWGVATRRLALGRNNMGGFKHFASLAEIAANVRAFRGLDVLVSA